MQFLEEFRDLASKGQYELALHSFKEFSDEISEMEKDKKTSMIEGYSWKQIKNELQKEEHLVHEILNELKFFNNAKSFGPQSTDNDESNDLFKANTKTQKTIQQRYDTHFGNKKQLKHDRLKHKRVIIKKHQPLRNRQNDSNDNKRNKRNRKDKKRERLNRKDKLNDSNRDSDDNNDNKYKPPSGIDHYLVDMIEESVIQRNIGISWNDIASLDDVKKTLKEVVILPTIIPEYFKGIRSPFGGILLFGPPGTGKTMLAKAVASTANCTFFNVSPSLIVSKWRGDSPKLIRILFEMARYYAPSVIFFDEIDSIGGSRGSGGQHDASRQMKSELLIQMDGVTNSNVDGESHVMVLAATNYPWLLDEALRRRLEKRIFIGLPDHDARITLFKMYFKDLDFDEQIDFDKLSKSTEGYNGCDIQIICRNASMVPIRNKLKNIDINDIDKLKCSDIQSKITQNDIESVIQKIKSSVSKEDVDKHKQWFDNFGSL